MRPHRVSEDVIGVSDLRSRTAEFLEQIAETGAPLIVTQHGRAAGVLLSPAAFDDLTEHARVVAAINEGLEDVAAGRVVKHDDLINEMKALSNAARGRSGTNKRKKR